MGAHAHVGQMRVNPPIPASVASRLCRMGLLENLPRWGRLRSVLETAMFAAAAAAFQGGVGAPLPRHRARCLAPPAESHSSGQQTLADCPLEAAPEPDRMSRVSTSSRRPPFSLSAASLSTLFCAPLKGLKREK